jgi:hypothetical protein
MIAVVGIAEVTKAELVLSLGDLLDQCGLQPGPRHTY